MTFFKGSFFRKYPRRRKLISLNKVNTGEKNNEFNLRHDWNSLIIDKINYKDHLKFTLYTNQNFPNADFLVKYLEDFRKKYNLNIKFNSKVFNINCYSNDNIYQKNKCSLQDQRGHTYICK